MQNNPGEQFRTRRQQFATQIRRSNREQIISKRRNMYAETDNTATSKPETKKYEILDSRFESQITKLISAPYQKQSLLSSITSLSSPQPLTQHKSIINIRKYMLSNKSSPLVIQQLIDSGIVPMLFTLASQVSYPQVQFESVWCLANIVSGTSEQTAAVVEKGGIRLFIGLIGSAWAGVAQRAIWGLGNIICDSAKERDVVIKNGAIKAIVALIEKIVGLGSQAGDGDREILETCVWTLSCICRTKPLPNYLAIKDILPAFFYLLKNKIIKDLAIIGYMCWSISYYTTQKKQGPTKIDTIQNCIDSGVVPIFIQFLGHTYDVLVVTSLKIIGNIARGTDKQSQYLLSLGVLDKIQQLLGKAKKVYRRESCWILSNITNGPIAHVQAVFSRQKLVNKLLEKLSEDSTDVKVQICYIFANATQSGDKQTMLAFLLQINFLKYLTQIIKDETEKDLLYAALECLDLILQFGREINPQKKLNPILPELYRYNVLGRLEELQQHDDEKVYEQVVQIITSYLEIDTTITS